MKHLLHLILPVLIFCFSFSIKKVAAQTQFLQLYPSFNSVKICQIEDGSYAIAAARSGDVALIKTDAWGNVTWQKSFSRNNSNDYPMDIKSTKDSGFIIGCVSNDECMIIRTNSSGDSIWTKCYDVANPALRMSINNLNENYDGSITAFGNIQGIAGGSLYGYMMKLNSSGDTIFTKSFYSNSTGSAYIHDVFGLPSNNGSYFIQGLAYNYYLKIDSIGNTIWTYASNVKVNSGNNIAISVFKNNEYYIVGPQGGGSVGPLAIQKIDSTGNLKWAKAFSASAYIYNCFIKCSFDGSILVLANSSNAPYVFKCDSAGNLLSKIVPYDTAIVGGSFWSAKEFLLTKDSGFICVFETQYDNNAIKKYNKFGISSCSDFPTNLNSITPYSQFNSTPVITYLTIHAKNDSINILSSSISNFNICSNIGSALNVWPGDCNYDLTVDNTDFLYLNIAMGDSGVTRSNASINWMAQPVANWNASFSNGANHKHADTDGNGIVDLTDSIAISQNYGLNHLFKLAPPSINSAWPSFEFVAHQDTMLAGDTARFDILLSNPGLPIDSIYGIAFKLGFDPSLVDSTYITINYDSSALGLLNTNMASFLKSFCSDGIIDLALCRYDHLNANSISGKMATISFKIKDTVPDFSDIIVSPITLTAITHSQSLLNFNLIEDTVVIINCNKSVTINIPDSSNYCSQDTINLVATIALPMQTQWFIDSVFYSNSQQISVSNLSTGFHIIKLIASNSFCTQELIRNINVGALPDIELGNDTTNCLQFLIDAGAGFSSYQWSNGETTQSIVANFSSLYIVTVVDANSCKNNDSILITINPLPQINLGNDTSTCNQPVLLEAGSSFVSYQWNNGSTTPAILVDSSGYYIVYVVDSNGCGNVDAINVSLFPLPAINLGNDTTTCNGPLLLDAGAGNISYQWSNGATTESIVANSSSLYSVNVTDTNGCSNVDSILININPLPTISFNAFTQDTICLTHGIQTISNGNPVGGNFSGVGVSGNLFDPTVAGVGLHYIMYEFTDSLGCSNTSTDSVFVDLCLGVVKISGNDEIKIYPNPAHDILNIQLNLKNTTGFQLEVYNQIGMLVKSKTSGGNNFKINVDDLSSGLYFGRIIVDSLDKQFSFKFAIEN